MRLNIIQKNVLISAMRGSGKSILVHYLLDKFIDFFDDHLIICPTNFSGFYDTSNYKVKDVFDDKKIGKLLETMKAQNHGIDKRSKDFKNILLVLDDCICDIDFKRAKNLQNIIVRGRHYGVTLLFVVQYLKSSSTPPMVRVNSDYIFVGKMNRQSQQVLENEFNVFDNKKKIMEIMKEAGQDYKFVVIDQSAGLNDAMFGIFRVPLEENKNI